jgi:hypothetical protein
MVGGVLWVRWVGISRQYSNTRTRIDVDSIIVILVRLPTLRSTVAPIAGTRSASERGWGCVATARSMHPCLRWKKSFLATCAAINAHTRQDCVGEPASLVSI